MPIDEAVLDFHALGEVETAAGPRTRVVVVAVRREMVERLHAACDAAGLQVEGVDLAAFGMLRALPRPTGATLYVAVGGLVNVAVANESGCLFTRAAAGGLEAIASSLADRAGSRSSTRTSGSGTSACSPTSTTSRERGTSSRRRARRSRRACASSPTPCGTR